MKKKRNLLVKEMKKKRLDKMRLQTDQGFKKTDIEQLNKKFNIEM